MTLEQYAAKINKLMYDAMQEVDALPWQGFKTLKVGYPATVLRPYFEAGHAPAVAYGLLAEDAQKYGAKVLMLRARQMQEPRKARAKARVAA